MRRSAFYVNKDYFKQWSPEMAWILGYISADGCIRGTKYEISIKSIDYEMLEFVQKQLSTNYQIKEYKRGVYQLSIYGAGIVNDLISYGMTPRKSLTLQFPNVPDQYFWDYLRGEVDGDGHIVIPKTGSKCMSFGISGNRDYLTQLLKILNKKIGCPLYAINPQGKGCQVHINGKHAYECLKQMYQNDRYGLGRKKSLALRSIDIYEKASIIKCKECHCSLNTNAPQKKLCDICRIKRQRQFNKLSYNKRVGKPLFSIPNLPTATNVLS